MEPSKSKAIIPKEKKSNTGIFIMKTAHFKAKVIILPVQKTSGGFFMIQMKESIINAN